MGSEESSQSKPYPRLNVTLIPDAVEALMRLQIRTGLNKNDVTNRALQVYQYFDAEIAVGNTIMIHDAVTRKVTSVKII